MTFWRPAQDWSGVRKAWWDTPLSHHYGAQGLAAELWVKHFIPTIHPTADNDRDGKRW